MSSKKKPRPLFEVPADIEPGRESGWVYRSARLEQSLEQSARDDSAGSIVDAGSATLALGMAALAQTMVLGLTIAAIPITLGIRALHAFTRSEN